VVDAEWVRGHGGGNGCGVTGEHRWFTAAAVVAAEGLAVRYSDGTISLLPEVCFASDDVRPHGTPTHA
jgi:hypothetical protein